MGDLKQKINILGTEYGVYTDDKKCIAENADGICQSYEKRITIRTHENYLDEDSTADAKLVRMKEVCRHEVIHAFFNESGLADYSEDERLVDWMARQFPKMLNVFRDMNAI